MHVNAAERLKAQETNCAFCSAAGAVNLILGSSRHTSSDVSKFFGSIFQGSMSSASGGGQTSNIIQFVESKTNQKRKAIMAIDSEISLTDAINRMKNFPARTVFVMHIFGMTDVGDKCSHWLNAILTTESGDRALRYFDFQTNRVLSKEQRGAMHQDPTMIGGANPSSSLSPFVGIIAQDELLAAKQQDLMYQRPPNATAHRALHAARQKGTFLLNTSEARTLIAFPP